MATFLPIESRLKRMGFNFVVGIDEAGRGPLAGPVVSAAVILKDKAYLPGLDDSKKLSSARRSELFEQVLANALDYSISIIPQQVIDARNILKAVQIANDLCLQNLSHKPDIALIDGRDKQIIKSPFCTIIKGDGRIKSIAAASILAKVTRDALMGYYAQEFPNYGFQKHMGYGTREHRSNISKYGLCEIHRKSYTFKP